MRHLKKLLLPALIATAPSAQSLELILPIDCQIGRDCVVQRYVDHAEGFDPSTNEPAFQDFACGHLTTDANPSTDFRVTYYELMEESGGVPVKAAADGWVIAMRDGMQDKSLFDAGDVIVSMDKQAGNGILIDHGKGWETQYSHLKRGSLKVYENKPVKQGDIIGYIGTSGESDNPHLSFTVRQGGRVVDPFTGTTPSNWSCGDSVTPLWDKEAQDKLIYQAAGVLRSGFSPYIPSYQRINGGLNVDVDIERDDSMIVFWAQIFGLQAGDVQTIRIIGPDGEVFSEQEEIIRKNKPEWFIYTGRKNSNYFNVGQYKGIYTLRRKGLNLIEETVTIDIQGKDETPARPHLSRDRVIPKPSSGQTIKLNPPNKY